MDRGRFYILHQFINVTEREYNEREFNEMQEPTTSLLLIAFLTYSLIIIISRLTTGINVSQS